MCDVLFTCDDSMQNHAFNITNDELKEAMIRINDPNNPDNKNGLITKIWGPPTWESFHAFQFNYPINPTEEDKINHMTYYEYLGKVLPCSFCRESYATFIAKDGDCPLTMDVMKSRETLTRWGHALHDRVNKKLGVDYLVTYEELCYKYEPYRAKCTKTGNGCVMPANYKAKSYQHADIKRAPVIDKKYADVLIEHAATLELTNYNNILDKTKSLIRNTKEWMVRDIYCKKMIKSMRVNGMSSLDENGLPSKDEMILISMLCSNLSREQLDDIYEKIIKK